MFDVLRYKLILIYFLCFYNCDVIYSKHTTSLVKQNVTSLKAMRSGLGSWWRIRMTERQYFVLGNTSALAKSLNKRRWHDAMYIWFTLRMRTPAVTFYFGWVTHLTYCEASVPWSLRKALRSAELWQVRIDEEEKLQSAQWCDYCVLLSRKRIKKRTDEVSVPRCVGNALRSAEMGIVCLVV